MRKYYKHQTNKIYIYIIYITYINWIFSLFTLPFPGFPFGNPLAHLLSPFFYEGAPSPTHSPVLTLAFPYTGPSNTLRPKGHSSY
jgi:hypothetical protein